MIEYISMYLNELWNLTCMMAPWLLFGFLMAGILSLLFSTEYIKKHLGGSNIGSIIKAALIGIPLPLCSCGVIPVTAALRKQGASRGAAGAFVISTPQTGVDSIFVTYSMLGWIFALFKPLVALITGIIGGIFINWFGEKDVVAHDPSDADSSKSEDSGSTDVLEPITDEDFLPATTHRSILQHPLIKALHYAFSVLIGDIALPLIAGIMLAALVSLLVPDDFGVRYLSNQWLTMPAMLLFGVPLYVCSSASIPIAAALIAKGISPGAVLVFLITGPATNAATISSMNKILGRRSTILYLLSVICAAITAGIILDALRPTLSDAINSMHHYADATTPLQQWSAGVLIFLIAINLIKKTWQNLSFKSWANGDHLLLIKVKGPSCDHCWETVRATLSAIPEVNAVHTDATSGRTAVSTEKPEIAFPKIEAALRDEGFSCNLENVDLNDIKNEA